MGQIMEPHGEPEDWEIPAPMWAGRTNTGWMQLFLFLAGLCGLGFVFTLGNFLFILPGVVFLLAAASVWRKHFWCGECGNPVTNTSRLCPTCGVDLAHPSVVRKMERERDRAMRPPARTRRSR